MLVRKFVPARISSLVFSRLFYFILRGDHKQNRMRRTGFLYPTLILFVFQIMQSQEMDIGYKKCGERVLKLEILVKGRNNLGDHPCAEYECLGARVLDILDIHGRSAADTAAFKNHVVHLNEEVEHVHARGGKLSGLHDSGISYRKTFEAARFDNDLGLEDYTGPYENWYANGQVFTKATCKNGKFDGLYERWYKNEIQCVRETYEEGLLHGSYESWYTNGKRIAHQYFKRGVKHGPHESWYPDGQPWIKTTYKDGELCGTYEAWEDGKQVEKSVYRNGERISKDDEIL